MDSKKNIPFKYRLGGITTKQFAILEQVYNKESDGNHLSTCLGFGCNPETEQVAVNYRFQFEHEKDSPFLIIEVETFFKMEPTSWAEMKQKNKVVLPKHFAAHIAGISVGHVRGVLHVKTEQTQFCEFMIPLLNPLELIPEDVIIDIAEE